MKSSKVQVRCGSLSTPLEILIRLSQAVYALEEDKRGYAYSLTKSTTGCDTLYLIQHTRSGGCGDPDCNGTKLEPGFLGLLMQALQQLEATVPHDLIYGFLAFKGDININVDYNAPVNLAWRDAARAIVRDTLSLDIFSAARGMESCVHSLPSWVPNWSQCYPCGRPICAPDFRSDFRACNALLGPEVDTSSAASCPHLWQERSPRNEDILVVSGKVLGTVSWLSPPNFEGVYYREGLKKVLGLDVHLSYLKAYLGFAPSVKKGPLLEDTKAQLMRTLLADGAFGHGGKIPDSMNELIEICDLEDEIENQVSQAGHHNLSPIWKGRKEQLDRCREWSLIVQRKKLFLCDRRDGKALHLGLAPRTIRVGDVVAILRGSKVPVVLRKSETKTMEPIPSGDPDADVGWEVVGQCYLDQWMDGRPPAGTEWCESEKIFLLV